MVVRQGSSISLEETDRKTFLSKGAGSHSGKGSTVIPTETHKLVRAGISLRLRRSSSSHLATKSRRFHSFPSQRSAGWRHTNHSLLPCAVSYIAGVAESRCLLDISTTGGLGLDDILRCLGIA